MLAHRVFPSSIFYWGVYFRPPVTVGGIESRAVRATRRVMAWSVPVFLLFLSFAVPEATRAQATGGSISGTVTREAGGTMPAVRVSLSDLAKTVSREVTTDNDGVYNLPDLPPAVYEITVSAPGFITQMWTAITVGVGTDRVINIVMRLGDSSRVVRAAAPPAPVSQASSCCGGNVNASTVRSTPLNGRDWAQLATLQAGVTGVQTEQRH
jgi:hypothetical protein